MFESIGRGWEIMKVTLGVIRQDKHLLLFPVLSAIASIIVVIGFIVPLVILPILFGVPVYNYLPGWSLYLFLFLMYVVLAFVQIYFNVCIVASATIRLNGGSPVLADGLAAANKHIVQIFLWAVISATVGAILRAIRENAGWIGRMVAGLLGLAWAAATFFVIPVMIYEGKSPWASIKRSIEIVRRIWAEAAVAVAGMAIIFVLIALVGVLLIVGGAVSGNNYVFIAMFVLALALWMGLALVYTTAKGVLVAALYRYAQTGMIAPGFPAWIAPPMMMPPVQPVYQAIPIAGPPPGQW